MNRVICSLSLLLATTVVSAQDNYSAPSRSIFQQTELFSADPGETPVNPSPSTSSEMREIPVAPYAIFNNAIEIAEGRLASFPVAGITTAFSNDPRTAECALHNDVLVIYGKTRGEADVLVLTAAGIKSIAVIVKPGASVFPPGFVPPAVSRERSESGAYEFRLDLDRKQIQNRFDLMLVRPERTSQLHLVTSNFLEGIPGYEQAALPSGFYRIATRSWKLTLLDETVNNSALTVNQATLRGVHLQINNWTLHAGYSALATFHDFLLPTERETAIGIGYSERVSPHGKLTENFYYFPTPPRFLFTGRTGGVGSAVYRFSRPKDLEFTAELGFSRSIGAAADIQYTHARDLLHGAFQHKPRDFPSLSIGNLPGQHYELQWTRTFSPRLVSNLSSYGDLLLLPAYAQRNLTSTANLQYRLSRSWTMSSGSSYTGLSQTSAALPYSIRTLSFPQQINFDIPRFGAGLQYQASRTNGSFALGQLVRGSMRITNGGLQLSTYIQKQTDALSATSVISQIPGLEFELQKLGITISDPQQLTALLQDTAFLQSLGFLPGTSFHLIPRRTQFGGNLTWASKSPRPARFNLDLIHSTDQLLQGTNEYWVQSGNYTRPFTRSDEFSIAYSWFNSPQLNQRIAPTVEIGIRHGFHALPSFLNPVHHGSITGIAFVDEDRKGSLATGMARLPGVEVVLDGAEHTRTDDNGRYIFTGVAEGQHAVEMRFMSDQPFWFTTPSNLGVSMNSSANFGITFAASELVGFVRNDAGIGVEDVDLDITGPSTKLQARSDASGRFIVPNLPPGDYTVTIDAESVPLGYMLDELAPVHLALLRGLTQKTELNMRALRTFSGQASYYDVHENRYLPLTHETVTLTELARQTTTDDHGAFVFRELPAGDYTMHIVGQHGSLTRAVSIPQGPADLHETFEIPAAAKLVGND